VDPQAEEIEEAEAEAVGQNISGEAHATREEAPSDEEAPDPPTASGDIKQPAEDAPIMADTDSVESDGNDSDSTETRTEDRSSQT
jgi:hypothetical protein